MIEGGIRHERYKDTYDLSQFSAGVRYSDRFDHRAYWFADAAVSIKSYSGELSPGDSTCLKLGGGSRYYFDRLSEKFAPYGSAALYFQNTDQTRPVSSVQIENLRSFGINYDAIFGIRMSLSEDFFLDLESPIFAGELFKKNQRKNIVKSYLSIVKNESEDSANELFFRSFQDQQTIKLSFGIRL